MFPVGSLGLWEGGRGETGLYSYGEDIQVFSQRQSLPVSLTLLHKGSVDKPHGVVESRRCHGSHLKAWGVEPVEEVDQEPHQEHRASNAGPEGEVKGGQAGKHVHCLLCLAQQHAHRVVHVTCREVHHVLPVGGDGQGRDPYVSPLRGGKKKKKHA